jgi:hypothetical protein
LAALGQDFPSLMVQYAEGCSIAGNDTSGFAAAIAACQASDVCVAVMGSRTCTHDQFPDCQEAETLDRRFIELPGMQEELVLQLAKLGKPLILVLATGSPLAIPNLADPSSGVGAIVLAWNPGEAGGNALWALLFGKEEFSGRLPVTWPMRTADLPLFTNMSEQAQVATRTYLPLERLADTCCLLDALVVSFQVDASSSWPHISLFAHPTFVSLRIWHELQRIPILVRQPCSRPLTSAEPMQHTIHGKPAAVCIRGNRGPHYPYPCVGA